MAYRWEITSGSAGLDWAGTPKTLSGLFGAGAAVSVTAGADALDLSPALLTLSDGSSATIAANGSTFAMYKDSSALWLVDLGTSGTTNGITGGSLIGTFVSNNAGSAANASLASIDDIDLSNGGTTFKLKLNDSVALNAVTLSSGSDSIQVETVAGGAFTFDASTAAGGDDVITFTSTTAKVTATGDTGAKTGASGSLTLTDETNKIKFGSNQTIGAAIFEGFADKTAMSVTLASATTVDAETTKNVYVSLNGATKVDLASEGALTLAGTAKSGTKGIKASSGTITFDTNIFGASTEFTSATVDAANSSLEAAEGAGVINITSATIAKALTIKSANNATVDLDINTITAGVVTFNVASGGKQTLDLADTAGGDSAKYVKVQNIAGTPATNIASITAGVMKLSEDSKGVLSMGTKGDATSVSWAITDIAGAANLVGGTGADTITVGLKSATAVDIKTNTGADTIKLTNVAGTGATIDAGAGDDIFDLTDLSPSTTGGSVIVKNFGSGKSAGTEKSDTNGYDRIWYGPNAPEAGDLTGATLGNDTNGSFFVVKGVKFYVESGTEATFVKIGSGTSATNPANYKVYQVDATNGLQLIGDESDNTSSGNSYDTADSTTEIKFTERTADKGAYDVDNDAAVTDKTSGTALTEAFTKANKTETNTRKYLNLAEQTITGEVKMGNKATNYVVFEAGSKATANVNVGSKEAVIAFSDQNADLTNVSITGYKSSTKDVLVAKIDLDSYTRGKTDKVINSDGSFGTAIVKNNDGVLVADKKNDLYRARFREAYTNASGEILGVNGEVLLVGGSDVAGKDDFSSYTISPIYAYLADNGQKDTVVGTKGADVFHGDSGDVITGGKGDDTIYSYRSTVVLGAKGDGKDVVNNWEEYNGSGRGVIQMGDGKSISDFKLGKVDNANKEFTVYTNGADSKADLATFNMSVAGADADNTFNTQIKDGDKTYSAVLMQTSASVNTATGAAGDNVTLSAAQSEFDAFIGANKGLGEVYFGEGLKRNINLGGEDGQWGDNATYVNVMNVKTAAGGNSILFNNSKNSTTLTAGGANDSLWGASSKADTLVSNDTYRTFIGTGKTSGLDLVQGLRGEFDAVDQESDVVYFLDGITFLDNSGGKLVAGTDSTNALVFANDNDASEMKFNFGFKLNDALSTAVVALKENTELTYDDNAMWYIGSVNTTLNFNDSDAVQFGYLSNKNGVKISKLNGEDAAAGSIINGSNEGAQTVVGSANGASSIAGGFGEGFVNTTNDTLVGGAIGETTFYVGKDMGNDVLREVSDGDVITFLGTKFSDLTGTNALANSANFSFSFANNTINARLASGKTLGSSTKLIARFDDGDYTYGENGWTLKQEETSTVTA